MNLYSAKQLVFNVLLGLFLFGLISNSVQAQINTSQKDSIALGILPALSYSSDFGLFGGAIFSRYNYGINDKPFKNSLLGSAILSTKGYVQIQVLFDKVRHFDTDYRASYEVSILRLFQNNFFGIGNNTTFDQTRWETTEDYLYESRGVLLAYKGRYPLYKKANDIKRFDVLFLGNYTYELALERVSTSQLSTIRPLGIGASYLSTIGTGFFWENRDNEILPTKGSWTEMHLLSAVPGVSSKWSASLLFRQHNYFTVHFIKDLTLATRIYWRQVLGESSFWNLADAGYNSTLRGYPFRRFIDKGALTYNIELRTWLFEIPSWKSRIGGYFFTDAGRVFSDFDDYANIFKDYNQTFGFGGTVSFFNPNFFLRGEFGFSKELTRFYAGVGYLF